MDDFMWRAALGGIGIALISGPVGCFVVWRRMAYFGATLAHAALLGVALGLALRIDLHLGVLATGVLVSGALYVLDRNPELASDTLLGILAHSSLAVGLVLVSFMDTVRLDLTGYLFGDVLSIQRRDLAWIGAGGSVCLGVLAWLWRPLLAMTVHEDLARVEGVKIERLRFVFLLLVAVVVALAMQIVGLLLAVSLLILPAATARRLVTTPEAMAAAAVAVGAISVLAGLWGSFTVDTPAGPSIVVAGTLLFAISLAIRPRG
jgi:zinc transport system permease protein